MQYAVISMKYLVGFFLMKYIVLFYRVVKSFDLHQIKNSVFSPSGDRKNFKRI